MEDFQQRVIEEHKELDQRLDKLQAFRGSAQFRILPREDQVLLNRQAVCMEGLLEVLAERIKRFKPTFICSNKFQKRYGQ